MFGRQRLALEINVGSEADDLPDRPAKRDSNDAAQDAHGPGFGEEKLFHVTVAGADRLHDPYFAPALKNGHHQRVYDSDGGDGQRQAAEDSEECVQHRKELRQTAAGVENRERGKAIFLMASSTGCTCLGFFTRTLIEE